MAAQEGSDSLDAPHQKESKRDAAVLRAYKILDSGRIAKWGRTEDFDKEFGTSFSRTCKDVADGEVKWNVLDLEEQKKSPRDDWAAGISGWYVAVGCYKDGTIVDYYLSNTHK